MRVYSIRLTQRQASYLRGIKENFGLSFSGYIRNLLMQDMLGTRATRAGRITTTITKEVSEVVTQSRGPQGASQVALLQELKEKLRGRRQRLPRGR